MRQPTLYPAARANARHFSPGGLLDLPAARRWQRAIEQAVGRDWYGYQLVGGARPGERSLSSYDYLGLIGHPVIVEAAQEALARYGTGSGGVRMLTGTNELHLGLEAALAAFAGTEAALTLTSGYLANLTPLAALFGPGDLLLADERVHRSLAEAARLSRADVVFFRHNDADDLERLLRTRPAVRRRLIISEGVFSMDGDVCPLPDLIRIKRAYGAFLLIDEAHSLGVLGPGGRGVAAHFGVSPSDVDLWTGSLSKAVPSNGGYVAGDAALILFLQHAGAPYFFSSALAPPATAAARAALRVMEAEPERAAAVRHNAAALRTGLAALGFDTGLSQSAIVPVITGSSTAAHELARWLAGHGLRATAVVFPAVPRTGARLRLCATASWSEETVTEILAVFARRAECQSVGSLY